MYEIEKHYRFEAAHELVHHDGKCRRPHGHTYHMIVRLRYARLTMKGPKKHMAIDFQDINAVVHPLIEHFLDHHRLNDTLQTDSPTAEWIAQWLFHRLKKELPQIHSVTVYETPTSGVTYTCLSSPLAVYLAL